MFADVNSLMSGLLPLARQPISRKGRSEKVKDGISLETKSLVTISVDRCTSSQNGREPTVNRVLDVSIYPGSKLVHFSLKIFC